MSEPTESIETTDEPPIDGLVHRARSGDESALLQLQGRVFLDLFGYLRGRLSTDDDVQRVVELTFDRLPTALKKYNPRRNFLAFIFGVSHWARLDFYRERKKHRARCILFSELRRESGDDIDQAIGRISYDDWCEQANPEEHAEHEEAQAHVALAVAETLSIAFNGSALPHQAIVFGFCVPLEWQPGRVHGECAERELVQLRAMLRDAMIEHGFSRGLVESCLSSLLQQMSMTLGQLLVHAHWRQQRRYGPLQHRIVGDTYLRCYYGPSGHGQDIPHWWDTVVRSIVANAGRTFAATEDPGGLA